MSGEEAAPEAAGLIGTVEYSTLNLKHSPSPTLEEGHVMSERVQSLASQIYTEFENMIRKYDEEVVKDLMPLIVMVLESLERSISERGQLDVNLELLKEDNHQLLTQFEREKQMRKTAEDRMFLADEVAAEEKAKFAEEKETIQSICKMLELKARNAQDQASRLEEKERELRRELQGRRDKYNDLLRTHTEHVERTKLLLASEQPISAELGGSGGVGRFFHHHQQHKQLHRPLSQPGSAVLPTSSFPAQSAASGIETRPPLVDAQGALTSSPRAPSGVEPDSAEYVASLRDELAVSQQQEGPPTAGAGGDPVPPLEDIDPVHLDAQGFTVPIAGCAAEAAASERRMMQMPPPPHRLVAQPHQQVTPEALRTRGTNEASLFEEVSGGLDAGAIGEIDVGADIVGKLTSPSEYSASGEGLFGMSREIENLIKENADLIETKNALNIVKDDLIAKVDELTSEKDMLREEVNSLTILKNKLKEKLSEMEAENRGLKEDAKKARMSDRGDEDDESVPMAQRKRFTRIEMARVLMERNQYKERLMELQEAVRWTEMLRANRETPQDLKKKKGSLFSFANFFKLRSSTSSSGGSSSGGVPRSTSPISGGAASPAAAAAAGLRYRATIASSAGAAAAASPSPVVLVGDPTRAEREAIGLPASQNRAYDFLLQQQPQQQLQQQSRQQLLQQSTARLRADVASGRPQAYGWALPRQSQQQQQLEQPHQQSMPSANSSSGSGSSQLAMPVPIYCRPLLDRAKDIKVWCAAAVSAGPRQFRRLAATSTAAAAASEEPCPLESPELASLDEQLLREQAEFSSQLPDRGITSVLWICASEHSTGPSHVCIVDANRPAELLQAFTVSQSHVLTVACVPGPAPGDFRPDAAEIRGLLAAAATATADDDDEIGDGDAVATADEDPLTESPPLHRVRLVRCVAAASPNQSPHASSLSLFGSPPARQQQQQQLPQAQQHQPQTRTGCDLLIERGLSSDPPAGGRLASLSEPTMWLGCQSGLLFVHSAVSNWRRCLQCLQLKDAVVAVCHLKGRVFLGLANGSLLVFCRHSSDSTDQQWDLSRYYEMTVSSDPSQPLRVMTSTAGGAALWVGVQNTIKVVDPRTLRVVAAFDAHPRADSAVRLMCPVGEGVWIGFRLDTVLRLFHAHSHAMLQEVDVEPYISQMLGTSRLGFSLIRVTSLFAACRRLWIGTSNGIIVTVPFTAAAAAAACGGGGDGVADRQQQQQQQPCGINRLVPRIDMDLAQLSFHGHKDAVKFFLAVPGKKEPPVGKVLRDCDSRSVLVISGGEGYIDFRVGDPDELPSQEHQKAPAKSLSPKVERSHLIVWQVTES